MYSACLKINRLAQLVDNCIQNFNSGRYIVRNLVLQRLASGAIKHDFQMYSRTSMARTLMADSPWLARTIIMVPTNHFMHNPSWMAGTTLG